MSLTTNAVGRWQYRWHHTLPGHELESETHLFDVVAWERKEVAEGLKSLREAIQVSGASPKTYEMLPFELSFMRLERAATLVQSDNPADSPADTDFLAEIRRIRELLSGKPVPEEFQPKPIKSREAATLSNYDYAKSATKPRAYRQRQ